MKKLYYLLSICFLFVSITANAQQINHALTATSNHSGGGQTGAGYGPNLYNDNVVPPATAVGTNQWGWVSTNGWIEYTWTAPVSINAVAFYKANRPMSTCTLQYWDGVQYVNFLTYNNTTAPYDSVSFPTITTTRFRMFNVGGSSNPNHREIRTWLNISTPNDAGVASVDSPRVFCAGVENVVATIANYGSTQIDSIEVGWAVNGVNQTPIQFIGLLDTIGGANPWNTQVNLGTYNFPAGSTTISAWTMNPNGVIDTTTVNDTSSTVVTTATPPNAATVISAGLNSANATIGNAGNIDYVVVPFGAGAGSGTPVTNATSPFTVTGLSPSTTYDLYVRTNCGAGNVSAWVGPTTFNTAYAIPYFENFESFNPAISSNPWPSGWSSTTTSNPRWESEDANNGNNENSLNTGPLWDHTFFGGPNNGMYIYMETSGGAGNTAEFISPPILIDTNYRAVKVSYWYFMHGATMGTLNVFADTNGTRNLIATYSGQQQMNQSDEWLKDSIFLGGYEGQSVQLIFSGTSGTSFTSDIAIDDIAIDSVPPYDAAVTSLVSPAGNICGGIVTPVIAVGNLGYEPINSVMVYWDINGNLDSLLYTNTINPGTSANVSLSPITISTTQVYNFSFTTGIINGTQADLDPSNNDLVLNGLRTGLAGTVTLDPSLPASSTNFIDFNSLVNTINNYGVCGNAVVNVANGVYNGAVQINEIPGASSTNTLTIDGGDSSLTTIVHNGVGSNVATLTLNGSDWVTIKNFTIEATGTSGSSVIFTGDNYNCNLTNNELIVSTTSTSSLVTNVSFSGSMSSPTANVSSPFSDITIENNRIIGGYYGIRMFGTTPTNCARNRVANNRMESIQYYGMYAYYQDSLDVVNNHIDQLTRANTNGYGIYMYTVTNSTISANNILSADYGMYWSNTNTLLRPNTRGNQIINNMISCQDYGVYAYALDSIQFWYNSILNNSASQAALFMQNIPGSYQMENWDLRNNILHGGSGPALQLVNLGDSIFVKMDNNLYQNAGGTLIDIDGTTYGNLASYQAASPLLNTASLQGNPQFISSTDLHIIGGFVNDSGDVSVPIFEDIDGDIRPAAGAASSDIGADEFDPPTCLPPIALRASDVSFDSASIAWSSAQAGVDYQYIVVNAGSPPSSGVPIQTSLDSVRIGGLTASTTYQFYVRLICGRGDTSVWIGPSTFNTLIGVPYLQDFEGWPLNNTGLFNEEGWFTNGTLTPHWEISRLTTSSNTGPAADHTVGAGGTFLHLECSGGGTGDRDTLWSAPIFFGPTQANVTLKFWYHMYGSNMGSLEVYALSNGTYSPLLTSWVGQQQANQNDPWRPDSAFVNGYNGQLVQIVFVGIRGTGFRSDMAIDDVELYESLPVGIEDQKREGPQFSLSPNPSNGEFTMRLKSETTEQMQLNVLDMNGREVHAETISVKGQFTKDLDFTHLPKGMYFFRLQNGEVSKVEKIIIQ